MGVKKTKVGGGDLATQVAWDRGIVCGLQSQTLQVNPHFFIHKICGLRQIICTPLCFGVLIFKNGDNKSAYLVG